MKDLIEALNIFLKYDNPKYPTHCEHDELTICVSPALVSAEDIVILREKGFLAVETEDCFKSFRYGSA